MKTAISIPDDVFRRAEGVAQKLELSRSGLYSRAVAAFVEKHEQQDITASLNDVYASEDSTLEPSMARLQGRSLEPGSW